MPNTASDRGVVLAIGEPESGGFTFGPFWIDDADRREDGVPNFLKGPITVVEPSGARHVLDDRNGVEPLALACFRSDLQALRNARSGRLWFGDHDYGSMVEAVARDGAVCVTADLPSEDVYVEVATLRWDDLDGIIRQIDDLEAAFGPLVGHCDGCGRSSPTYRA